jgi:acyl-CoA thioesterase II
MGDLGIDTAVHGSDGQYSATLSSDWDIWGPNGGYVAAVALRAAGAHTSFARPASFTCHFLGVANYEQPVDLEVVTLRQTKRAESLRVSMTQDGKPILEAVAWVIGDVDGLVHDYAAMPEVKKPSELKSISELLPPEERTNSYKFWFNFDEKPIQWLPDGEWQKRPPGDPVWRHWLKFQPTARFKDSFADASRLLVALDVCMWPAACQAYGYGEMGFIAPSLDLSVVFHRVEAATDWLLLDGFSPIAQDGIVGGDARVWSENGELLCSGVQSMLCRPAPAP